MSRLVLAVVAAAAAFLVAGLPLGVVEMADPDFCFAHEARPAQTSFHEEALSLLPPGPECRFTLGDGRQVVAGPGWSPALVAVLSAAAGLAAYRYSDPHRRRRTS